MDVDEPQAIGADETHAVGTGHLDHPALQFRAFLADFGEPRRNDNATGHAGRCAIPDVIEHQVTRHGNHGHIDLGISLGDFWNAGQVEQGVAFRIDGNDAVRKAQTERVVEDTSAELALVFRCADKRHAPGVHDFCNRPAWREVRHGVRPVIRSVLPGNVARVPGHDEHSEPAGDKHHRQSEGCE